MTRKVRNPKRPDANGNHVDKTLTARAAERDAVGGVGGAFIAVIKEALDHTNSPTWLGQHTPLAQPYFLGHWLANESDAHTPKGRGRVLARLLLDSVKSQPGQRTGRSILSFPPDDHAGIEIGDRGRGPATQ